MKKRTEYVSRYQFEPGNNYAYGFVLETEERVNNTRCTYIDHTYKSRTHNARGVFPRFTQRVVERIARTISERLYS